jgi:CBS domain-containing protein
VIQVSFRSSRFVSRKKRRAAVAPEVVTLFICLLGGAVMLFSMLGRTTRAQFESASQTLAFEHAQQVSRQTSFAENNASMPLESEPSAAERFSITNSSFTHYFAVGLLVSISLVYAWGYSRKKSRSGIEQRREEADRSETESHIPTPRLRKKREQIASILSENWESILHNKLTVEHFMTREVTVVNPEMKISEIRELVHEKEFRHLVVCNKSAEIVGVISDRDQIAPFHHFAAELMTRNPIVVHQDIPVVAAVSQMITNRISCLPVTNDQHLVGILTTSDVMIALQCTLQMIEKIRQAIQNDATGKLSTTLSTDDPQIFFQADLETTAAT